MRREGTDDIDLPSGYEMLKLDSRASIALPASVARASRQALAERESAMNEARREELRRSHDEAKAIASRITALDADARSRCCALVEPTQCSSLRALARAPALMARFMSRMACCDIVPSQHIDRLAQPSALTNSGTAVNRSASSP